MPDIGPEGLSFYRGIRCPIHPLVAMGLKVFADDVLVELVESGKSVKSIGDQITTQMDAIEETLRLADGAKITEKAIQCVIDKFPGIEDKNALLIIWYTSVHILLKIGRLENDDMNGMMYKQDREQVLAALIIERRKYETMD